MTGKAELQRLQGEAAAIQAAELKPVEVEATKTRLLEKWSAFGKPGLEALEYLHREKGKWLRDVMSLNWCAIEAHAASAAVIRFSREAESLAKETLDSLNNCLSQSQSIPARIATLDPAREASHLIGCKESDYVFAEMIGREAVKELRTQINMLESLLSKIKTRENGNVVFLRGPVSHCVAPDINPNNPTQAEVA